MKIYNLLLLLGYVITVLKVESQPTCDGCSAGFDTCHEFDDLGSGEDVYACGCAFSGGLRGDEALDCCADGYHLCRGSEELTEFGLTTQTCLSTIPFDEAYWAQEGSSGWWNCNSDGTCNRGINDIWGCTGHIKPGNQWPGCDGNKCNDGLNIRCEHWSINNDWNVGGNGLNELLTLQVINSTKSGVMCCVDPPIPSPTPPSAPCNGCSNGPNTCYEFDNLGNGEDVYACKCSFEGGLKSDEALGCCADGYHLCSGGVELKNLGLTKDTCLNTIPFDEAYWAQEGSNGWWDCASDRPADNGVNDVWGCTGSKKPCSQWPGCDGNTCDGALNIRCESGSKADNSGNIWDFGTNAYAELNNLKVIDGDKSGVMCCANTLAPTSEPTVIPTPIPTSEPTVGPTSLPTHSPTVCDGCSGGPNTCREFNDLGDGDDVYACKCAFEDGLRSEEALGCCANGYHLCSGGDELFSLGLTTQTCLSTIPSDEAYWTQEGSSGWWNCNSDPGGNGVNDVWGCTGSTRPRDQWPGCDGNICDGALNIRCEHWSINNDWNFGGNGLNELENLKVINDQKSGVMCCEDTPAPTAVPTVPTSVPTSLPTQSPTVCNGCSAGANTCREFDDIGDGEEVFACKCAFEDGLRSEAALSCCADGYHLCKGGDELFSLGVTTNTCKSNIPTDEAYWTQEGSSGWWNCNSDIGGNGVNDVWGCTGHPKPGDQWPGCDGNICDGSLNIRCEHWSINNDWNFGGNGYNELENLKVINGDKSGVMCCLNPTSPPSFVPSLPPTTPSPTADITTCDVPSKTNIMFILDESGSIASDDFIKMKHFVKNVIKNDIDDSSNVGIVSYSNQVYVDHEFTDSQVRNDIYNTINNITQAGGLTYISDGVETAINEFINIETNDNLIILITDGDPNPTSKNVCDETSNYQSMTTNINNALNNVNIPEIEFIVIGVSSGSSSVNLNKMECLVDNTQDLIPIDSFTTLDNETFDDLCKQQSASGSSRRLQSASLIDRLLKY